MRPAGGVTRYACTGHAPTFPQNPCRCSASNGRVVGVAAGVAPRGCAGSCGRCCAAGVPPDVAAAGRGVWWGSPAVRTSPLRHPTPARSTGTEGVGRVCGRRARGRSAGVPFRPARAVRSRRGRCLGRSGGEWSRASGGQAGVWRAPLCAFGACTARRRLSPPPVAQIHEAGLGGAAGPGAELAHLLLGAGLRPWACGMSRRRCRRRVRGGRVRVWTGRSRPRARSSCCWGSGPAPGAGSPATAALMASVGPPPRCARPAGGGQ